MKQCRLCFKDCILLLSRSVVSVHYQCWLCYCDFKKIALLIWILVDPADIVATAALRLSNSTEHNRSQITQRWNEMFMPEDSEPGAAGQRQQP